MAAAGLMALELLSSAAAAVASPGTPVAVWASHPVRANESYETLVLQPYVGGESSF
jgi:hypothetical protein